jgi:MFS family permease
LNKWRGLSPLPLLTLVNFFNYLDRQVVYGMAPAIQRAFHLSETRFGLLATVNLFVFAVSSLISGPISDRIGPRKVIFAGVAVWAAATIGSALSTSFPMLLGFRALVGVGEGAYGPSANSLLCADAPEEKRGRALGIYNVGMAVGGTTGLVAGTMLEPVIGWNGVFWVAGAPSVLLALAAAMVRVPERFSRPTTLPAWKYLLAPTYLIGLAGGALATFGASGLIVFSRKLVIESKHFSVVVGSIFMACVGLVAGVGGVVAGGYAGDRLSRRYGRGGHALTIGLSSLLAVPFGVAALMIDWIPLFAPLMVVAVFLLSVYNGPSAAVVDELGPPQFAATLQAAFLFGIHVLGNDTAPTVIGFVADHASIPIALQAAVAAFGLSGVMFVLVARRQRAEGAAEVARAVAAAE